MFGEIVDKLPTDELVEFMDSDIAPEMRD